jgi:hypothetical protein
VSFFSKILIKVFTKYKVINLPLHFKSFENDSSSQKTRDEGKTEGQQNLKNCITNFYKELFGPPEESLCTLDSLRFGDIPQVKMEENDFLT